MGNAEKHPDYSPYELRDYQQRLVSEAQSALSSKPSLLATAPTGAGKCLGAGTPVAMYDGSVKPVERIKSHDLLAGPDGAPHVVLSTNVGYGRIARITPETGPSWRCNLDHVMTLGVNGHGSPEVVQDLPLHEVLRLTSDTRDGARLLRAAAPGEPPDRWRRLSFNVEEDHADLYYGFTLNGDGRFLLADGTVTHNTVMFADICAKAAQSDHKTVIMVHRQELVQQAVQTIRRQAGIDPGVVWKDRREYDQQTTVLAHGCIAGEGAQWWGERPHLLIIDEAHHTKANGWMKSIERLSPRFLLGFTATPFRFDRNPLTPVPFAQVNRSITPTELIAKGVLVPPVIVTPVNTDAEGNPVPINKAANPADAYLRAVRYGLAQGRRKFIIYVSGSGNNRPRENARRTVELLSSELGLPADSIDDSMSALARETAVARYRNTNEAALVNYATLTEGVDIPETDCLVIGRATRSESSIIQMLGRGIRSFPGKTDCLVIDYTGRNDLHQMVNYYRTDDVDQEEREAKERERGKPEPAELIQMNTAFPETISRLLGWRLRLPWFKPWQTEALTALCTWHPSPERSKEYRYLYVRHLADGSLATGNVRIRENARPPYRLRMTRGLDEAAVANWLKEQLAPSGLVNALQRQAPWRLRPATDGQKASWERATGAPASERSTFGEISDLLAKAKFTDHVAVSATR